MDDMKRSTQQGQVDRGADGPYLHQAEVVGPKKLLNPFESWSFLPIFVSDLTVVVDYRSQLLSQPALQGLNAFPFELSSLTLFLDLNCKLPNVLAFPKILEGLVGVVEAPG